MYRSTLFSAVAAGALFLVLNGSAQAQTAIMPAPAAIDANTFIVGHPASPRWKLVHDNGEHPAVLLARQAAMQANAIDPNTFLVQPPATVQWLASGEPAPQVLVAKAR